MSIKNWMKPSYIKAEFLKATKRGWVYTNNHDEVIIAVSALPAKLANAGLNPDGTLPNSPVNTVAPLVTGIAQLGNTLSATTGTWTGDAPITYTYVWHESPNGTDSFTTIDGETTNAIVLTESHDGKYIRVTVTGTNTAGNSSTVSNVVPRPLMQRE